MLVVVVVVKVVLRVYICSTDQNTLRRLGPVIILAGQLWRQ